MYVRYIYNYIYICISINIYIYIYVCVCMYVHMRVLYYMYDIPLLYGYTELHALKILRCTRSICLWSAKICQTSRHLNRGGLHSHTHRHTQTYVRRTGKLTIGWNWQIASRELEFDGGVYSPCLFAKNICLGIPPRKVSSADPRVKWSWNTRRWMHSWNFGWGFWSSCLSMVWVIGLG